MATATKKKPGGRAGKKKTGGKPRNGEPVIQFPVKCGNVSIGEKTISIPIKIERENCSLSRMDQCLVARRLTAHLVLGAVAAGDAPAQQALDGMDDSNKEVSAVIQTSGVSVSENAFGVTLNFNKKDVEHGELDDFAKKQASLIIDAVDEIPDEYLDDEPAPAPADGDEDDAEE
jgi:hypothetical protein